ncbi:MAG: hypothetical protein QOG99_3696, partial [Frankiales bacterium]|nr:hypothetical protein [Frankiales bacterium]
IGSFQAVKHRCADMLVAVELIRAAVLNATAASPEGGYERAVATAAAIASDAYLDVAAANLQLHGGLGFTWEHSAHLYVKRARSMRGYLGDPIGQRREVAELLGI